MKPPRASGIVLRLVWLAVAALATASLAQSPSASGQPLDNLTRPESLREIGLWNSPTLMMAVALAAIAAQVIQSILAGRQQLKIIATAQQPIHDVISQLADLSRRMDAQTQAIRDEAEAMNRLSTTWEKRPCALSFSRIMSHAEQTAAPKPQP
jgi:hypothetical protein